VDSLRAAAARVDITPPVGTPGPLGPQGGGISQINGRIYGAVLLLRHGRRGFAWLSLNQCFITAEFEKAISRPVAEVLGISENDVVIGCTRNLASPLPFGDKTQNGAASPRLAYHDQVIDRLIAAARQAAKRLAPVTMRYAEGSLPELQYNRKGRRPDGTTFFMREADRLANPDWTGLIDPRVPVLRLDGPGGRPVAVVTQYTGDPCIATQLERPVVSPDLPGYAAEYLAEQLGEPELPVLYFQGCKGDIAVKYMFAGEDKAREAGRRLGAVMGRLAEEAQTTSAEPLCSARGTAVVPLEDLPLLEHLEKEKVELAAFDRRLVEGNEAETKEVLGHNFPGGASPSYRRDYAETLARWTNWAIKAHKNKQSIRREVRFDVRAFRLGDVGLVTTWAEMFGSIGLNIQKRSPFPHVVVACCCGHTWPDMPAPARWAYVPGACDLAGGEYMTAFYRHTRFLTQYAPPAGDAIGDKAVELLDTLKNLSK